MPGLDHEAAPRRRELGQVAGVEHARGVQRDQLAVAVAPDHVGLQSQGSEQPQHPDARGPDGRLGHVRPRQRRRASSRAASSKAGGAKTSGPGAVPPPAITARSNSSNAPRTSGNATASSRSIPGAAPPAPGTGTPPSHPPTRARPRRRRREGPRDPPGPPRSRPAPAAASRAGPRASPPRSPGRHGPSAPRFSPLAEISVCDRSRRAGRAPASSARARRSIEATTPAGWSASKTMSSAGQSGSAEAGAGVVFPRYSSRTAWKFVPPKPKALTPARRGRPSCGWSHGSACVQSRNGPSCRSSLGLGVSMPMVGGSTL